MHLFGSTDSGHSYKIKSYLELAGIPHTYEWVDLGLPRVFRPMNFQAAAAYGEVPVLVHGARTLCQSNAILLHLADETGHFSGAPTERRRVAEWLFWEANRIGFSVPNLRYALGWVKQPPDVMRFLRERAVTDLRTLNNALASSRYLLASGLTIADLCCSAYLHWLDQIDVDQGAYPHVQRWLAAIRDLPGWRHPDLALQPERAAAPVETHS